MTRHDDERRYDGPVPQRKDAAAVQESIVNDILRLRARTVHALAQDSSPEDMLHLRKVLAFYDAQLARIDRELEQRLEKE